MSTNNEEEEQGAMPYVLAVAYGVLAVWGVYTTFIVSGALVGTFEEGKFRFAVALLLALVFPILTAMGFNNVRKEGVHGIEILNRVLLGTAILSLGTSIIIGITMTEKVLNNMRQDPNWFVEDPYQQDGFPAMNRKYHRVVAEGFCKAAHQVGTYYCPPA